MKCSNCNTDNGWDALFCENCGMNLKWIRLDAMDPSILATVMPKLTPTQIASISPQQLNRLSPNIFEQFDQAQARAVTREQLKGLEPRKRKIVKKLAYSWVKRHRALLITGGIVIAITGGTLIYFNTGEYKNTNRTPFQGPALDNSTRIEIDITETPSSAFETGSQKDEEKKMIAAKLANL